MPIQIGDYIESETLSGYVRNIKQVAYKKFVYMIESISGVNKWIYSKDIPKHYFQEEPNIRFIQLTETEIQALDNL